MAVGCFVPVGRSLDAAVRRLTLAEQLGYESCWVTHINARDSLTVIAHYATRTSRIRLGTGVVPIYSRTPATMAQTAVTIDEASGGRLDLGLGLSHRPVVEAWHGQAIDRPVAEMREYVGIVRAILRGEAPPAGEKWRTSFVLGMEPRPDIPVYVAALSPGMLRLAGEIADGVVLWLCTPPYIADVVVPEVAKGRERAGRPLDGFDVVAAVPAARTDDVTAAWTAMRRDLLPYFGLPFYRAMLERSGFGDEIAGFDQTRVTSAGGPSLRGPEAETALMAAISERFLRSLTAVGDDEQVRAGIRRYADAGATSPCVSPVGGTDFEATLRAAAP